VDEVRVGYFVRAVLSVRQRTQAGC